MPDDPDRDVVAELYPYPVDGEYHPLSFLFFNMPHLVMRDIDTCHAMASWLFGSLGCAGPGSASAPLVKYDARGTSGAPWEDGVWIAVDKERAVVQVTTPEVDLTDMSEEKLAEVITNAQAALVAKRAGTTEGV